MAFYGDGKHNTEGICTPHVVKKRKRTIQSVLNVAYNRIAKITAKLSEDLEPIIKSEAEAFLARFPTTEVVLISHTVATARLAPGYVDSNGATINTARIVTSDPFLELLEDLQLNTLLPSLPCKITYNGTSAVLHYA